MKRLLKHMWAMLCSFKPEESLNDRTKKERTL